MIGIVWAKFIYNTIETLALGFIYIICDLIWGIKYEEKILLKGCLSKCG